MGNIERLGHDDVTYHRSEHQNRVALLKGVLIGVALIVVFRVAMSFAALVVNLITLLIWIAAGCIVGWAVGRVLDLRR